MERAGVIADPSDLNSSLYFESGIRSATQPPSNLATKECLRKKAMHNIMCSLGSDEGTGNFRFGAESCLSQGQHGQDYP